MTQLRRGRTARTTAGGWITERAVHPHAEWRVFAWRTPARASAPASSSLRDMAEGLRWTVRHGAVRTLALTILIFNSTFGAAWSVLVL